MSRQRSFARHLSTCATSAASTSSPTDRRCRLPPAGTTAPWPATGDIAAGATERAIADHGRGGGALGGIGSLEALARIHGARGDHAGAAGALERLCDIGTDETLASGALRLAEAYVAAGDRAAARARLEKAAASVADGRALRARLAELYRDDASWDPLSALFAAEAQRAESSEERLLFLRKAIELDLFKRSDPESAIPLLDAAVALAPDDALLGLTLGEALLAVGRPGAAVKVLEAQVERYGSRKPKERALTHYALSRASAAAGSKPQALEELDAASRIDWSHPGILHALGRLASDLGELARAARAFQALLLQRQPPEETPVHRAYHELVELLQKPGDARDGDLGRAELLLELADIAEREGDLVRAQEFRGSAAEAARSSPEESERHARALAKRSKQT